MIDFYDAMIEKRESPAATLRSAQRNALKDSSRSPGFFWAGFVYQGDWQARPFADLSSKPTQP